GAYTARAAPTVSVGTPGGVQVVARAVIDRRSFAGVASKYGDSKRPPRNQRAANVPSRVRTGRRVRANARQMPAALSLRTIAFRIPGPHHSFSVDRPTTTDPASTASVDCPKSTTENPRSPKRNGRSIE